MSIFDELEPKEDLPSDSKEHWVISNGVRHLPKPQHLTVTVNDEGCRLCVGYHDGVNKALRISKRVAEVLIADGMPYGN